MIAVVDYRKGNLKSVERGLRAAGGDALVTDDARVIGEAEAIVLPGVGAFADAAAEMAAMGQMAIIRRRIAQGVPFLGICLGMHLMFSEGTEGAPSVGPDGASANPRGLSLIPGIVDMMPRRDAEGFRFKVPHVGWNSIDFDLRDGLASSLLEGIAPGEYFYFTHSYIAPPSTGTVATTVHSVAFPSVVRFGDAAFGVQFHPEKSSDAGAQILRNFIDIVKGA